MSLGWIVISLVLGLIGGWVPFGVIEVVTWLTHRMNGPNQRTGTTGTASTGRAVCDGITWFGDNVVIPLATAVRDWIAGRRSQPTRRQPPWP